MRNFNVLIKDCSYKLCEIILYFLRKGEKQAIFIQLPVSNHRMFYDILNENFLKKYYKSPKIVLKILKYMNPIIKNKIIVFDKTPFNKTYYHNGYMIETKDDCLQKIKITKM